MNPILLVVTVALIVFGVIYCMIVRPRKPLLTAIFLFLLVVYLFFTFIVNNAVTPSEMNTFFSSHINKLLPFITYHEAPSSEVCLRSFYLYQRMDVLLFLGVVISLAIEIYQILIKPYRQ